MKLIIKDFKETSEYPEDYEKEPLSLERYALVEILEKYDNGKVLSRTIGYSSYKKGFEDLISELNKK